MLALLGVLALAWWLRPSPALPRVLATTQLTRDGISKTGLSTDGSRVYMSETSGGNYSLVQASVAGGDTSPITTPFTNVQRIDISADHTQLLLASFSGTESESPFWSFPLPSGTPRRLGDISGHSGAWSRDGRLLIFGNGSDVFSANVDGTNARKLLISEETQHPLILVGIFIVVFLAIHPFKDGNGRLSRVLTTLLLLRAGYGYVPYSSRESVIEANKDNYYLALRRTQQTIRKGKQNWEYWLVFFLRTMVKQKNNLAAKVKEEQALRSSLPALSRQILELAKTRGEITAKEIEESTGANRNTVKAHLRKLASDNYLAQVGKGRGARYTPK
jgi:hypothetical protein